MSLGEKGKRVAIVDGVRTPFAKRRTAYNQLSAYELGKLCVAELVHRSGVAEADIEQLVFGKVMPSSLPAANIARDIVVGLGLRPEVDAYTVAQGCISSYRSTVNLAQSILAGFTAGGIAGGADSASDVPLTISKHLSDALSEVGSGHTLGDRLQALSSLRPKDLAPVAPELKDPSVPFSMGEAAEKMAQENHIDRAAQDSFAHRSHTLAARAYNEGKLDNEVMHVHVPPDFKQTLSRDNSVRFDSNLDAYHKLAPVFDAQHGTITAGTSSPLTDGAAAILLMREDKAESLGKKPLGYLRSFAFVGVSPEEQMLIGPAYAMPLALGWAGLELSNMDVIDLHEAFAAQVLSVTQAIESDSFAQDKLGRDKRVGEIDWNTLNPNGGTIAMGHPFAATGVRQMLQTLHELNRRGGEFALCSACAAGGLGAAVVLEAA